MCLNISSLPLHFNELHTTLALLEYAPDIALSETRITTKVNSYYNPHLENYKFYQSQSNTIVGSVGAFIKNSLVEIRDDLDITVPGIFETLWLDVEHKQNENLRSSI